LGVMLVRRHVPESPRWLFIHGKEAEAERIVDRIEAEVRRETQRELPEPGEAVTVRQRDVIPFREIAGVAVRRYPRRAVLGLAPYVGQACRYNAIVWTWASFSTASSTSDPARSPPSWPSSPSPTSSGHPSSAGCSPPWAESR